MQFDFDERYQQVEPVGTAISRREGIMFAAVAHVLVVIAFLFTPRFLPARSRLEPVRPPHSDDREVMRFVLTPPPKQKPPAQLSPRGAASDANSVAQSPELVARAENLLPTSTGESRDPVDTQRDAERPISPDSPSAPNSPAAEQDAVLPLALSSGAASSTLATKLARPTGVIGAAISQWQRHASGQAFHNPNGGAGTGSQLQFDSKGVDFGPWIRRFVAQVKRNWMVPNAVMGMRGSVVVQFNVDRDGALTDVTVVAPSPIESFNRSAVNALMASNPTQPLPPEYPDDRAFFTFTFYFNEPGVP